MTASDQENCVEALVWYARCQGIRKTGPFATQVEATSAVMDLDGEPAPGAFVWPEKKKLKA